MNEHPKIEIHESWNPPCSEDRIICDPVKCTYVFHDINVIDKVYECGCREGYNQWGGYQKKCTES